MKFSKKKGIDSDLGEMKINLNPNAKPVKQWPYRLNPWYKENVKDDTNRILYAKLWAWLIGWEGISIIIEAKGLMVIMEVVVEGVLRPP